LSKVRLFNDVLSIIEFIYRYDKISEGDGERGWANTFPELATASSGLRIFCWLFERILCFTQAKNILISKFLVIRGTGMAELVL
jgi:hypothetical protein